MAASQWGVTGLRYDFFLFGRQLLSHPTRQLEGISISLELSCVVLSIYECLFTAHFRLLQRTMP